MLKKKKKKRREEKGASSKKEPGIVEKILSQRHMACSLLEIIQMLKYLFIEDGSQMAG